MDVLVWIIYFLLIVVAVQYVVGPILVLKSQRYPVEYSFRLFNSDEFLNERTETFMKIHKELLGEGFEYLGSSELISSHSSMYFSIYNNFDLKLACTLSTAHSQPTNSTQIEFTQMYSDGSVLNVNDNPIIDIYPRNEKKLSFRFPRINSVNDLLNVSRKLINAYKVTDEKITFERGEEFSIIETHLNNELQSLISRGWVSKYVNKNERMLTLKGAILMTWKLCWPVKNILENKEVSFSARALNNA